MERHLRDSEPRWALLVWPEIPKFAEMPCCLTIAEARVAVTQGARIVLIEDETFCHPRQRIPADPVVLRIRADNPLWFDERWGYDHASW